MAATKESSLEKARACVREKKADDNSPCSSMGAEVDRPISDVELLRIMECPVCNEFPAPPIYSCEKGHFTCNSCIRLLDTCSLCEAPFTNVRNFALESIIENSKFKCRNAHLGCELIVSGGELNQHVAECFYRPLECIEPDCLRTGLAPIEYFNHLVDNHGISGCERKLIDGKAVVILTQKEDCENENPYYIRIGSAEDNNCTILIFSKRYRTFYCWWACCLEPQKLTKYEISLSLDNTQDSDSLSVCWKLPLQPVWKTFDQVRDTGRCAVLPDTHLIPFTDKDHWNLQVEITEKDFVSTTNFQHYYPLLLLALVGIIAVISSYFMDSGLNWFHSGNQDFNQSYGNAEDVINQKDFSEEYIGYRGFYYKAD